MKLTINTSADPKESLITSRTDFAIQTLHPFFYGDKLKLEVEFVENDIAASWLGSGKVQLQVGLFDGTILVDVTEGIFNGITYEWLLDFNSQYFNTFTENKISDYAFLEIQRTDPSGLTHTLIQQDIEIRNQFLNRLDVELTIPIPPGAIFTKSLPIPRAPDDITSLASPRAPRDLLVSDKTRGRTEDPTTYEPDRPLFVEAIAMTAPDAPGLVEAIRSPLPEDVEWVFAGILPAAPSDLDAIKANPNTPLELEASNLWAVKPLAATAIEMETIPLEPSQIESLAPPVRVSIDPALRSPLEPSNLVSYVDDLIPAGWYGFGPTEIEAEQLFAPDAPYNVRGGLGANPGPTDVTAYLYDARPAGFPDQQITEVIAVRDANAAPDQVQSIEFYDTAQGIKWSPYSEEETDTITQLISPNKLYHLAGLHSFRWQQQYRVRGIWDAEYYYSSQKQNHFYGVRTAMRALALQYKGAYDKEYVTGISDAGKRGYQVFGNFGGWSKGITIVIDDDKRTLPSAPYWGWYSAADSDPFFDDICRANQIVLYIIPEASDELYRQIMLRQKIYKNLYCLVVDPWDMDNSEWESLNRGANDMALRAIAKFLRIPQKQDEHIINIVGEKIYENSLKWNLDVKTGRYPACTLNESYPKYFHTWKIVIKATDGTILEEKDYGTDPLPESYEYFDIGRTEAYLEIHANYTGDNTGYSSADDHIYTGTSATAQWVKPLSPSNLEAVQAWSPEGKIRLYFDSNPELSDWIDATDLTTIEQNTEQTKIDIQDKMKRNGYALLDKSPNKFRVKGMQKNGSIYENDRPYYYVTVSPRYLGDKWVGKASLGVGDNERHDYLRGILNPIHQIKGKSILDANTEGYMVVTTDINAWDHPSVPILRDYKQSVDAPWSEKEWWTNNEPLTEQRHGLHPITFLVSAPDNYHPFWNYKTKEYEWEQNDAYILRNNYDKLEGAGGGYYQDMYTGRSDSIIRTINPAALEHLMEQGAYANHLSFKYMGRDFIEKLQEVGRDWYIAGNSSARIVNNQNKKLSKRLSYVEGQRDFQDIELTPENIENYEAYGLRTKKDYSFTNTKGENFNIKSPYGTMGRTQTQVIHWRTVEHNTLKLFYIDPYTGNDRYFQDMSMSDEKFIELNSPKRRRLMINANRQFGCQNVYHDFINNPTLSFGNNIVKGSGSPAHIWSYNRMKFEQEQKLVKTINPSVAEKIENTNIWIGGQIPDWTYGKENDYATWISMNNGDYRTGHGISRNNNIIFHELMLSPNLHNAETREKLLAYLAHKYKIVDKFKGDIKIGDDGYMKQEQYRYQRTPIGDAADDLYSANIPNWYFDGVIFDNFRPEKVRIQGYAYQTRTVYRPFEDITWAIEPIFKHTGDFTVPTSYIRVADPRDRDEVVYRSVINWGSIRTGIRRRNDFGQNIRARKIWNHYVDNYFPNGYGGTYRLALNSSFDADGYPERES